MVLIETIDLKMVGAYIKFIIINIAGFLKLTWYIYFIYLFICILRFELRVLCLLCSVFY
jgi:hypothetical protein